MLASNIPELMIVNGVDVFATLRQAVDIDGLRYHGLSGLLPRPNGKDGAAFPRARAVLPS